MFGAAAVQANSGPSAANVADGSHSVSSVPIRRRRGFILMSPSYSTQADRGQVQAIDDQLAPRRAVAGVGRGNRAIAAEPRIVQVAAGPVDAYALAVGELVEVGEPGKFRLDAGVRHVDDTADEGIGRRPQHEIAKVSVH